MLRNDGKEMGEEMDRFGVLEGEERRGRPRGVGFGVFKRKTQNTPFLSFLGR